MAGSVFNPLRWCGRRFPRTSTCTTTFTSKKQFANEGFILLLDLMWLMLWMLWMPLPVVAACCGTAL